MYVSFHSKFGLKEKMALVHHMPSHSHSDVNTHFSHAHVVAPHATHVVPHATQVHVPHHTTHTTHTAHTTHVPHHTSHTTSHTPSHVPTHVTSHVTSHVPTHVFGHSQSSKHIDQHPFVFNVPGDAPTVDGPSDFASLHLFCGTAKANNYSGHGGDWKLNSFADHTFIPDMHPSSTPTHPTDVQSHPTIQTFAFGAHGPHTPHTHTPTHAPSHNSLDLHTTTPTTPSPAIQMASHAAQRSIKGEPECSTWQLNISVGSYTHKTCSDGSSFVESCWNIPKVFTDCTSVATNPSGGQVITDTTGLGPISYTGTWNVTPNHGNH